MNARAYLMVSGVLFGFVSIFHLLRIVKGWELILGPNPVPVWASWVGAMVPALLCIWAFRLFAKAPAQSSD